MPRARIHWTICVLCSVAAAATALHGQQAQTAAHVLDAKGAWHLEGTTSPVAAGQGLSAGAKITAQSNKPGDAITIVRDEDMSRTHVTCDETPTNPCQTTIIVGGVPSASSSGKNQIRGIVQAALSVLLSKPPAVGSRYALTMTRGLVTVEETEAVVAFDPVQGVVLPPAPERIRAGRYSVSVSRSGERLSLTSLSGVLGSEGTWKPLQLGPPGVYEISILYPNQEQVTHLILLVTPKSQYQATHEAFEAMKARSATWTGPSARSDEHVLLRAFLLSQSQP